jgi:hypothetical protein
MLIEAICEQSGYTGDDEGKARDSKNQDIVFPNQETRLSTLTPAAVGNAPPAVFDIAAAIINAPVAVGNPDTAAAVGNAPPTVLDTAVASSSDTVAVLDTAVASS